MRRVLLITSALLLAFAGAALASYKTGTYTAGSSKADGVSLRIKHGKFSVSRVSYQETCENSSDSFDERFTFVKGSQAKLDGKIKKDGRLSGRYEAGGSSVTVKGRVKGSKAKLNVSESGSYTPQGATEAYQCHGTHSFTAKLLVVSTQH